MYHYASPAPKAALVAAQSSCLVQACTTIAMRDGPMDHSTAVPVAAPRHARLSPRVDLAAAGHRQISTKLPPSPSRGRQCRAAPITVFGS
ncbi:hypothetical protein NL676_023770 [Syzygium grande]|nr:hypothetical protein NL676_023770 [Syzygium grande]